MEILRRFIERTNDPEFDHASSDYLLDLAVVAASHSSEDEVLIDIQHYGDARVREALKKHKDLQAELKRLRSLLEQHNIVF